MRHATLLCLLPAFLPQIAAADDFPLPAPATEAVVFLQGATITRVATLDAPAGSHRLLVPVMAGANGAVPRVEVAGATLGAAEIVTDGITDGRRLFTPVQRAAWEEWRAAREAVATAQDARLRAAAGVTAAEDALAFLRSISGSALTGLDPAAIGETAAAISGGTTAAEVARADARAALRGADRAVADAGRVLAQAKRDLDASGADFGPVSLIAISVEVAVAGPVTLQLEDFVPDAGWSLSYDATLAGEVVTLARKVQVRQGSGADLDAVALRLSTADPFAAMAPSDLAPDLARVVETPALPVPVPRGAVERESAMADLAFESRAPVTVTADTDGPVVAYDYPVPVDVPASGDSVTLTMDTIDLAARVFNRAAPRTDATAFRMAEVTNTTPEPLLPGPATLLRDGEKVGESFLPLVPAGDEAEIAFGPVEHLRLDFVLRDNETGDRGLFVTSGTRAQDMVFRVRNLSDMAETVETRFALPYSEQEELEVSVTTEPAPDARDVDDMEGVAEWLLDVPAGGEAEVRIGVTMDWPEGQTLEWQP